ncbi:MAG: 4'-phosphopantetheinyl transferase superfamily protein [Bacteroidota bacterium]|nr:4'-phosphopantetheinyl transferase superfamily protein [Bacteroidota bacterium]
MIIIKKYTDNNCKIAVWNMCESLDELLQLDKQHDLLALKTEKRKKEFLASRLLLNELAPNQQITYNKYGAPELENGKFISISHSKNLVAIIVGNQKVGLDIEQISEKALRTASKFILEAQQQNITAEKATLIWCSKEAIFKWYQKGGVDFKDDIHLDSFVLSEKGKINANFKKQSLILNYQKINNHYLVYVCK